MRGISLAFRIKVVLKGNHLHEHDDVATLKIGIWELLMNEDKQPAKESKSISEAFARVIDQLLLKHLDDPKSDMDEKQRFRYGLLGSGVFFIGLSIFFLVVYQSALNKPGISEQGISNILNILRPEVVLPVVVLAIFSALPILFANMICHTNIRGRVRAYLAGLTLPLITLSIISTVVYRVLP